MRVNDTNSGNVEAGRLAEQRRAEPAGKHETPPEGVKSGEARDRLQLSTLASRMHAEETESPERTAKLERLAADFAAGRYEPDSEAISDRLIDDAMGR
jgi:anti-sigma28 factor (negative regulator of flagellin synthesis)